MSDKRLGGPCTQCGLPQFFRREKCADTTGACPYSRKPKEIAMTVRAKFTITKIERTIGQKATGEKDERGYPKYAPCEMWSVHGNPVYGNGDPNHENTKFWQASPSGSLLLGTVNADAAAYFELGAEYYVDFAKAA